MVALHFKRAAGLHRGEHRDEAFMDAVTRRDRPCALLFAAATGCCKRAREVLVGPPCPFRERLSVGLDISCHPAHIGLEAHKQHGLHEQEPRKRALRHQPGQVPLEDEPVNGAELTNDARFVHALERGGRPEMRVEGGRAGLGRRKAACFGDGRGGAIGAIPFPWAILREIVQVI